MPPSSREPAPPPETRNRGASPLPGFVHCALCNKEIELTVYKGSEAGAEVIGLAMMLTYAAYLGWLIGNV